MSVPAGRPRSVRSRSTSFGFFGRFGDVVVEAVTTVSDDVVVLAVLVVFVFAAVVAVAAVSFGPAVFVEAAAFTLTGFWAAAFGAFGWVGSTAVGFGADDLGVVGFVETGFATMGFMGIGFCADVFGVVGFADTGFATMGFMAMGFGVVGLAVDDFGVAGFACGGFAEGGPARIAVAVNITSAAVVEIVRIIRINVPQR